MKIVAAALLILLGSAHAVPTLTEDERRQERLVTDAIMEMIGTISAMIADLGLDPVIVNEWSGSFALPEAELFSSEAWLNDFKFAGLSNIVADEMNFSILQMRLRMTISMPSISTRIGSAGFELSAMGSELSGSASGSLEMVKLSVATDARVSVGVISGINIRSLTISPSLGGINSQLNIVFNERDLSDTVNDILGNRVPNFLAENKQTIEEFLVAIVTRIIEELL